LIKTVKTIFWSTEGKQCTGCIFGWGVSSELNASCITKAMVACDASNPYGILKANTNLTFYHPHLLFIIN
jgi:hypothetical protein